MTKVSEILDFLDELAPTKYAMSYDNVGLLVGDPEKAVHKILVTLDITDAVIEEAVREGADLIVSHHPVIFGTLSRLVKGDVTANRVMKLIENHISAICMHTNLDAAHQGVNDALAECLMLEKQSVIEVLGEDNIGVYGIGRIGYLAKPIDFTSFLYTVADRLSCDGLRYCKARDTAFHIAVGGGSCGSFVLDVVRAGCDTLVTSDIKHDQWLSAQELGLNLIDAGHFKTENVIVPRLISQLKGAFGEVGVSQSAVCASPMKFFTPQQ